MIWSKSFKAGIIATVLLALCGGQAGAQDSTLITDIESLLTMGESADASLLESIRERIQLYPAQVVEALLPRLDSAGTSEENLTIYVWALGLAGDPRAVDGIVALCDGTESELVARNCLSALASIGGERSGEYLLVTFDKTSDDNRRFDIINLLAQMQYESALPRTVEFLNRDFDTFYWQPVFVFGKFGDAAVPILLENIDSPDDNIRGNALHVVGQWLIPPEAAGPLMELFWKEKNPEYRNFILSSLEMVIYNLDSSKAFFEDVIAKEKKDEVKQFAKGSLSSLEMMAEVLDSLRGAKTPSSEEFQKQYDLLYKSAGKEGDYDLLMQASTYADEPKLKKLRQRILQRNSDESFYDYQNVNQIIVLNRFLAKSK